MPTAPQPGQTGQASAPDDGFDEIELAGLKRLGSAKWAVARSAGDDVIPSWVADMDFPAPGPVREALARLAREGDLRYPSGTDAERLEGAWARRVRERFGWSPRPGRLRAFTDLVQGTQAVLEVATARDDGVLLLTPSYPPFVDSIRDMGRRLLAVPAVDDGQGWAFDLEVAKAYATQARALLLVNPHNPTGRMLTADELGVLEGLAAEHDLIVISDEVHADLSLVQKRHLPFASLSPETEARTVTFYSASKSYNLGGMRCAVAHLGNDAVAQALAALPSHLLGSVSTAAVATTLAAWSPEGDDWLDRALVRLRANREALGAWFGGDGERAGVKGYAPEATYLAWLDFRNTAARGDVAPGKWLVEHARVLLSEGAAFGPGGEGFARVNFATTPAILEEILSRIASALGPGGQEPAGT